MCIFPHILALELPGRNDINLVRRVQKLYGYQMNLISVFYVSFYVIKYQRE